MIKAGRDIFVKAVLVLAVMMQVLAITPHHHHGDDSAPCIGFFHHAADAGPECCGGHDDNDGHKTCDDIHNNGDIPFAVCSHHNIVISQPEQLKSGTKVVTITLPDDCSCGYCISTNDFAHIAGDFPSSGESYPTPVHVGLPVLRYIAVALAPRAPDPVS